MVTSNELFAAALRYAELGYRVFPCASGDNKPATKHGFKDATTDAAQIENWWTAIPDANIGIAAEGLLVVDLDPLGPGEANPWLNDEPEKLLELATAPSALTPRGGRHHVFRRPADKAWRCTASRLAPRVDTRTDGGYFVVAPSARPDGVYRWIEGLELDASPNTLPEPPGWLAEALDQVASGRSAANGTPTVPYEAKGTFESNKIPDGQRNATLARLAGTMRRVGMSQTEMAAALHRVNQDRCLPPVSAARVELIAGSIARYEPDNVSVALVENHYAQMQADDDGPNRRRSTLGRCRTSC